MIAQLELRYEDGTSETVVSDGSWRQVESPVGFDCIREAEVIGAHHPLQPDFAARSAILPFLNFISLLIFLTTFH